MRERAVRSYFPKFKINPLVIQQGAHLKKNIIFKVFIFKNFYIWYLFLKSVFSRYLFSKNPIYGCVLAQTFVMDENVRAKVHKFETTRTTTK